MLRLHGDDSEMDYRLSRLGFGLNLFGFSSALAWIGIVASPLGFILSVTYWIKFGLVHNFIWSYHWHKPASELIPYIEYVIELPCLVLPLLSVGWFVMCLFLRRRILNKDIDGLEKIAKIVTYVSASLQLMIEVGWITFSIVMLAIEIYENWKWIFLGTSLVMLHPLCFSLALIHGVRKRRNDVVQAYILYRYVVLGLRNRAGTEPSRSLKFHNHGEGLLLVESHMCTCPLKPFGQ